MNWHIPTPKRPLDELDWERPEDREEIRSWIVIRVLLKDGEIEYIPQTESRPSGR